MFWWLKVHIIRPAQLCLWLVGLVSCVTAWLKWFSSSDNVCFQKVINCSFACKHTTSSAFLLVLCCSCQSHSSSGAALQSVSALDLKSRQTPPSLSLPNKPKHTAVAAVESSWCLYMQGNYNSQHAAAALPLAVCFKQLWEKHKHSSLSPNSHWTWS